MIKSAFDAARVINQKGNNNFIENDEFLPVLLYLKQFYEFAREFQQADVDGDGSITF